MHPAPPLAVAEAIQWLGVLAASAAAATAILATTSRSRVLGMLVALALVPVLLVGELWKTSQFENLRGHPAHLILLIAVAIVAVAALTVLFSRRRMALPVAIVAALPFRIPFQAGGTTANLLIPLYLVIAAGVLAAALNELRGGSSGGWRGEPKRLSAGGAVGAPRQDPPPGGWGTVWLPRVLAAVLLLYAIQSAYSDDFRKALENIVFFLVPFAIMFALLLSERWDRRLLSVVFGVLLAESLVFVVIGFTEYEARKLLWNPSVINANQFQSYFRVNSVFWDPNIYGRYLAMVAVAVVALMLWTADARRAVAAAVVAGLLWGGLLLTFSQSSFVALAVGLASLAALRWSFRWTVIAAAAAAAAAVAFLVAYGGTLKIDLSSQKSLDKTTSGRADLVKGGLQMAGDRPLWGYGSGSFARTFRRQNRGGGTAAVNASHTEPITVAAEQGGIGLALYLALVVTAFGALLSGIGAVVPGFGSARGPPDLDPGERTHAIARAAIAAAFTALLVHTFTYAAFLSDPITWLLLALGFALVGTPLAEEQPADTVPAPTAEGWRPVRAPA